MLPEIPLVFSIYPYLIASVFISVVTLGLVVLAIRVFQIESSSVKYQLMFLPLVMPFLAYFVYPPLISKKYLLVTEPLVMIAKILRPGEDLISSGVAIFIALGIGAAVVKGILNFVACYGLKDKYKEVLPEDEPELYQILEKLTRQLRIKKLTLRLALKKVPLAFAFGWGSSPTIVVSQGLLEQLASKEMEAVLAHELSHIARRDTLLTWFASILKNAMFYNPASHLSYSLMLREKEKACDDLSVRITKEPLIFAKSIFKVWKLLREAQIGTSLEPLPLNLVRRSSALKERVERLVTAPERVEDGSVLERKGFTWITGGVIGLFWITAVSLGLFPTAKVLPPVSQVLPSPEVSYGLEKNSNSSPPHDCGQTLSSPYNSSGKDPSCGIMKEVMGGDSSGSGNGNSLQSHLPPNHPRLDKIIKKHSREIDKEYHEKCL